MKLLSTVKQNKMIKKKKKKKKKVKSETNGGVEEEKLRRNSAESDREKCSRMIRRAETRAGAHMADHGSFQARQTGGRARTYT